MVDKAIVSANRKTVLGVFRRLRRQGLVAEAWFGDCGDRDSIWNVLGEKAVATGKRGFVYRHDHFHEHELYLGIGSVDDGFDDVEIAEQVVRALKRAGLSVRWNGDPEWEILVWLDVRRRPWKRRSRSSGADAVWRASRELPRFSGDEIDQLLKQIFDGGEKESGADK